MAKKNFLNNAFLHHLSIQSPNPEGLSRFYSETIGMNLKTAMMDDAHREAALVTFLVTVSGVSFGGIASAFWGILFGVVCLLISKIRFK